MNCHSQVTYIVKDMLKNPYNVDYVIFDILSFNVYICLILGANVRIDVQRKVNVTNISVSIFHIQKQTKVYYKTLQLSC